MKALCLCLVIAGVGSTAFAQTGPDEHRAHHPDAKASSEQAQPARPDTQQKMQEMRALMEKIEKTKDASTRERLLAQHTRAMREQMMSMTPMHCGQGMSQMGGGMGHPGGGGAGQPGHGEQSMMSCHQMMQERMNAIMGMMEQMLRHEDARGSGGK